MNIFITGAAQGIGAAIASLLVKKGHTVGIYDINQTKAYDLAKNLNLKYLKKKRNEQNKLCATAGKLDVTNSKSWDDALADFLAFAGSIDVLVNNAGILSSGKFENISLDKQLAMIDVNTKGLLMGCYKVKPLLDIHANAKVINLSSASSLYGQPDLACYGASKSFVRGLTEALDIEWSADGIRCIGIIPLYVNTDMVTGMETGSKDKLGVKTTPEEVAATVVKTIMTPNHKGLKTHRTVGIKVSVIKRTLEILPDSINRKIHQDMMSHE